MDDAEFENNNREKIAAMGEDNELREISRQFLVQSVKQQYSYHFRWLGRPIIQYPQDIVAMQELIWQIKPDVIVETGIARGGSLIFYASMLHLLDRPAKVIGVDIDIRAHNRAEIEAHPMARYIELVQGPSTAPETVAEVKKRLGSAKRVLVVLDSMHTHAHVLDELRMYSPLVTKDSYLVVFDTVIEMLPAELYPDRPWRPGDNAWTAVQAFIKETNRFEIDRAIADKLQITVAPDGYLKCVKE